MTMPDPAMLRSVVPALAILSILSILMVTMLGPRSALQRSLWLYMSALFIWSAPSLVFPNPGPPGLDFWVHLQSSGVVLAPVLSLHLSLILTQRRSKALLVAGYGMAALFLGLTWAGLLTTPLGFAGNRMIYRLGPAAPWMFLYAVPLCVLAMGNILTAHRSFPAKNRPRYMLIVLGMSFSLAGGISNFWPAAGAWPLDVGANTANALLIAYAMLHYRLLDLNSMLRRSASLALAIATLTSLYLALWLILGYQPGQAQPHGPAWLLPLLLALLLALGIEEVRYFVEGLSGRFQAGTRAHRQNLLLDFIRQLAASTPQVELMTRLMLDTLASSFSSYGAAIYLGAEGRRSLTLVAWSGCVQQPPSALPPTNPLLRRLQPGSLLNGDLSGRPGQDPAEILSQYLAMGIFRQSRLLGVLALQKRENKRGPGPEEQEWLQALVSHFGLALDNWLLQRHSQATYLLDSLTGLPNHLHFHESLAEQLDRFPAQEVSLLMADIDHFGYYNETFGPQAGDRALRKAAQSLQGAVRTEDLVSRQQGGRFAILLPGCPAEPSVMVAERCRKAVEGLGMADQEVRWPLTVSIGISTYPGDSRQAGELLAAAEYALLASKANGPNHVCPYFRLEQNEAAATAAPGQRSPHQALLGQEAAENYRAAVHALAAAREALHPETLGHSQRVARYALALAEALRLTEEEKDNLRTASLLHDIGKAALPEAMLHKADPWTEEDGEELSAHASLGASIILNVPGLERCLSAIQTHHERYDGSGYPQKLGGEAIPLAGRVLAIADAYEALVSGRPGSPALNQEEALRELQKGAGRQFDPRLVTAFVQIMTE